MGDIVVGIDIGTSKVCTVIGRVNKENQLEVVGRGLDACSGVKKGIIVDIENTSNSIMASIKQAETMAGLKVRSAYVNIMGTHVSVINSKGWVSVSNGNREITSKDVDRVLDSAGDISIPEDKQIVDVIPRQYIIDGYDEITDPVGMAGIKLEVEAEVVAARITSVQNIVKSMEKADIKINGLVVEALAAGEALLSSDEKEMGVVLIDIGGGITDISVFKNKKLVFYDSIPVGGDHITNDLSIGLKIIYTEAEKIKRNYELALTSLIKNDQVISVNDINDNRKKTLKISEMVEIIEARVYEILSLSREAVEKAGFTLDHAVSVVLTGGGISYLDGAIQLAEEVFEKQVRVAAYRVDGISKSEMYTAAAIVKYASGRRKGSSAGNDVTAPKQKPVKKESKFLKAMSKFFNDFF